MFKDSQWKRGDTAFRWGNEHRNTDCVTHTAKRFHFRACCLGLLRISSVLNSAILIIHLRLRLRTMDELVGLVGEFLVKIVLLVHVSTFCINFNTNFRLHFYPSFLYSFNFKLLFFPFYHLSGKFRSLKKSLLIVSQSSRIDSFGNPFQLIKSLIYNFSAGTHCDASSPSDLSTETECFASALFRCVCNGVARGERSSGGTQMEMEHCTNSMLFRGEKFQSLFYFETLKPIVSRLLNLMRSLISAYHWVG